MTAKLILSTSPNDFEGMNGGNDFLKNKSQSTQYAPPNTNE